MNFSLRGGKRPGDLKLVHDLHNSFAGITKLDLNSVELGGGVGLSFEKQPGAFAVFVSESGRF